MDTKNFKIQVCTAFILVFLMSGS